MSLVEGQYQIGNVKFGKGTSIVVQTMDQVGYEVSPGDYQMPMSDEIRFRKDYIKPGVMQFTLGVMDNYILPDRYPDGLAPSVPSGREILDQLKTEWTADEVRFLWGWVKPLTYCSDGQTRMLYGRPRNFASDRVRKHAGWYNVTAQYQLADRLSYDVKNQEKTALAGATGTIVRGKGSAPSWMSALIVGPVNNPVIKIGPYTVTMQYNLPANHVMELNSYPWSRRAIDIDGTTLASVNVGAKMIGNSPYLEDLRIPAKATWQFSVTGSGTTSATKMMVQWQEAYHAV